MLFNIFKKKETNNVNKLNNLHFHQVNIKRKKGANLYIGQFLSIEPEAKEDEDGLIDDVTYYFSAYNEGIVTHKISNQHIEYCENYKYGIVRNIMGDDIEVLIICNDGYLQSYKIETNKSYNQGDAFIISNGNLLENNTLVGKIVDTRYDSNQVIRLNCYDKGRLVVFIEN